MVIQTIEKININYLKELDKKVTLINLTYDIVFKSVFQRNKNLLKDYLNSLLNLNIKKESKITFLNNELYKENKDEYHKIVDLYLSINNQIFIDIELNKMPFEIVRERNNLYLNKLASMLLETGENIKKLKHYSLYQININAHKSDIDISKKVILYDIENKKIYPIKQKTIIRSLETYKKLYYTYGIRSREVIWNAALTAKTFTEMYILLKQILNEKQLQKFMKDVINMSKSNFVLHAWEKEKLDALVLENIKEYGFKHGRIEGRKVGKKEGIKEGKKEGKKEGIKEGIREGIRETAKNLFNMKMNIHDISKATGLSIKELKLLEKNSVGN